MYVFIVFWYYYIIFIFKILNYFLDQFWFFQSDLIHPDCIPFWKHLILQKRYCIYLIPWTKIYKIKIGICIGVGILSKTRSGLDKIIWNQYVKKFKKKLYMLVSLLKYMHRNILNFRIYVNPNVKLLFCFSTT